MNSRRKQSPFSQRRKVSRAVKAVNARSPRRTPRCPCSPVKTTMPKKTTTKRKTTKRKTTKKTTTRKTTPKKTGPKRKTTKKTATRKKTSKSSEDELQQLVSLHNLEEELLQNPKWRGSDGLVHWSAGKINPETGKSYTLQDLSPIYHKIKNR